MYADLNPNLDPTNAAATSRDSIPLMTVLGARRLPRSCARRTAIPAQPAGSWSVACNKLVATSSYGANIGLNWRISGGAL